MADTAWNDGCPETERACWEGGAVGAAVCCVVCCMGIPKPPAAPGCPYVLPGCLAGAHGCCGGGCSCGGGCTGGCWNVGCEGANAAPPSMLPPPVLVLAALPVVKPEPCERGSGAGSGRVLCPVVGREYMGGWAAACPNDGACGCGAQPFCEAPCEAPPCGAQPLCGGGKPVL
jgi:hypothetical protein